MGRVFNLDEIDDRTDLRDVLRSGDRLRVPMRLMDSAPPDRRHNTRGNNMTTNQDALQRDLARSASLKFRVTAADGSTGLSLNKPGYRVSDINLEAEKQCIYDAYEKAIGEAWRDGDGDRDKGPHGFGETGMSGPRVGDACSVKRGGGRFGDEGAPGHMRMVDGVLTCVADPVDDAKSVQDHQQRMARLYQLHDQELSEAWRQG